MSDISDSMASELKEAIKIDDLQEFNSLLSNNPRFLDDDDALRTWLQDHLLLAYQHSSFKIAGYILARKPEFSCKKYDNGWTAMHVASAKGDVRMVEVLERANLQLRLEVDNFSRTPLHIGAVNGHEGVVEVLADRESLPRTTSQEETALHLALKNHHVGVFEVLVKKVKEFNLEILLGCKDIEGDSLSHIAIRNCLPEALKLLLPPQNATSRRVVRRVNSINRRGQTLSDVYYLLNDRGTAAREINLILHEAGVLEPQALLQRPIAPQTLGEGARRPPEWQPYSKWPFETTNLLLVVFVMVAGAIFSSNFNLPTQILDEKHVAGAIFSFKDVISGRLPTLFYVLVFNAASFIMSMGMILALIWSLPFWTVIFFLLITFFIVYFLVVSKTTPRFSVRFGSRNIVSTWLVWLFAGGIIAFGVGMITFARSFLLFLFKLADWFKAKSTIIVG